MNRALCITIALAIAPVLTACSDTVRVTNLADGPVVCEIELNSSPPTDRVEEWRPYTSVVTCDLAAGEVLRYTKPVAGSLGRYSVRVWERERTGGPAQPVNGSVCSLYHSKTLVIRREAGKLVVGPDPGQER